MLLTAQTESTWSSNKPENITYYFNIILLIFYPGDIKIQVIIKKIYICHQE